MVVVVMAVATRPHGKALLVVVVFVGGDCSEAHFDVLLSDGLRGGSGLFVCEMVGREAKVEREDTEVIGGRG